MLVSAVVVNMNARELVLACVDSLVVALGRVDGPTEIVVVDNGSDDGGPDALRERFDDVRVLQTGANLGFPGAVNVGLRATTGEWVLLVNNDATIEPGGVAELLAAADGRPEVGSLAAQMRFSRNGTINSAGFGVDRLGVPFERHIGLPPESSDRDVTEVFGACGGGTLMRRAMLDEIGDFDGSLFLYMDDVDVAWRARMRGWTCLHVPSAVIHHHHSATNVHGSPRKHFFVGRNRVRMLAKHVPTAHLLRYGPAIVAYDAAYVVFTAVTDRTLAPLRGRLRGMREWRTYRARGRPRRPVPLEPVQGVGRALSRRGGAIGGTAIAERGDPAPAERAQ